MQRAAIARALIVQPSIVLADEPTGNLDSATGLDILNLLKSLQEEEREKRTLVLVTHDPAAAAFADRRVVLKDGRVEEFAGVSAG